MSRNLSGSWKCPGIVPEISRTFPRNFLEFYWKCSGIFLEISRRFTGNVISETLPGSFLEIYRDNTERRCGDVATWGASLPDRPVVTSLLTAPCWHVAGLPAVITLCLSLGTRRMAARRVIVRQLPSVETLGCTTVICTDKTGTLTTNQMTVTSLVTVDRDGRAPPSIREYEVEGVSYEPSGQVRGLLPQTVMGGGLKSLAAACTMCNDAEISYTDGQFTRVGEPTEAALKILVEKIGVPNTPPPKDVAMSASYYAGLRAAEWTKLATLEFSRTVRAAAAPAKPSHAACRPAVCRLAPSPAQLLGVCSRA